MNTSDKTASAGPPTRLHHYGCVVKDQEVNRKFMEDVLGFPLVATWAERNRFSETGAEQNFCHTFYELEDGSALAFFQFADQTFYNKCQPAIPAVVTRFDHIALRVGIDRYVDLQGRLVTASIPFREIDHGYAQSLYVKSPDGLEMEFAVDPPNYPDISARRRSTARADLSRWLSGDYTPNNDIR